MAAPIKADGILLDLDGTLWDAVEGICRGWNAGFAACGLEPGEYAFYAVTGSGPALRAEHLE